MLHRMALRVLPSLSLTVTEASLRKTKRLVMVVLGSVWGVSAGQISGATIRSDGAAACQRGRCRMDIACGL